MTKTEFEEVLSGNGMVAAKFGAEWCGPCKSLQPVFDGVAEENPDVKMLALDVEDSDELVSEYGVMNIPCVLFFLNGEPFNILIGGGIGKTELSDTIQNMRNIQKKRNG